MTNPALLQSIGIFTDDQLAEVEAQEALGGDEILALAVITNLAADGFITKRSLAKFDAMHRSITAALHTGLVALDDESFADLHRL